MLRNLPVAAKLLISFFMIIAMFLVVAAYSNLAFVRADSMYRYKLDYIVPRTEYLLEFQQEFTELRRLVESSFYNPAWLYPQATDLGTWRRYEDSISFAYRNMIRLGRLYIESAAADPGDLSFYEIGMTEML